MPSETEPVLGQPSEDVPTIEPDETCNGKRTSGNGEFEGYCDNPAGHGTNHVGSGRCYEHAGESGEMSEEGKIRARSNSEKHALTASPMKYLEKLDTNEESEFVVAVTEAIQDRIHENTGSLDYLDRVLARRVAVQLHIVAKASDHFAEEGLFERIFTPDGQIEVENRMLEHIRQYNKDCVRILKDIGATKDDDVNIDTVVMWRDRISD